MLKKLWQRGMVLAGIVLVLDQMSKEMVRNFLQQQNALWYQVTPFFNLVQVHNKGVSFGMFASDGQHAPWMLIAVAALLCLWLLDMMRRADDVFHASACGLILGGAIGNVIDRVRWGAVYDFLDFHWHGVHFWAFNVADTGISLGAALLMLHLFVPTVFSQQGRKAS